MMTKIQLKTYIRKHWKSLYIQGFGVSIVFLFLAVGGLIISGILPNPFSFEMITGLVLFLAAIYELNYFFKIAEEIKEKEKLC